MNHQKFYLNNNTSTIELIEKKYDFLPPDAEGNSASARRYAIDRMCRNKQEDIIRLKEKKESTNAAEQSFKTLRNLAAEAFLFTSGSQEK